MIVRASQLGRMQLCPGSYRAADGLFSPDSTDSISGRLVHEALALIWRKGQPLYQKVDEACEKLNLNDRQRVIAGWFTSKLNAELLRYGGALETWCEVPLRKEGLVGTCDLVIHTNSDDWLVIDWKTGGLEVKTAADNIQLGAYCAMGRDRFGYNKVTGYLFSAGNEANEQFTATAYAGLQLESLWQVVRDVIGDSSRADAPLRPSLEACRYCPALGNFERCRPSVEHGLAIVEKDKDALLTQRRQAYGKKLTQLQINMVTELYDKLTYAEKLKDTIAAEIYRRICDGEEFDGFRLTMPHERRKITDPERAYQEVVVNRSLATHDEFMKEVSMSGAGVQRACKRGMAERGIKVMEMKDHINRILTEANVLETKEAKPRLQRIGVNALPERGGGEI